MCTMSDPCMEEDDDNWRGELMLTDLREHYQKGRHEQEGGIGVGLLLGDEQGEGEATVRF